MREVVGSPRLSQYFSHCLVGRDVLCWVLQAFFNFIVSVMFIFFSLLE